MRHIAFHIILEIRFGAKALRFKQSCALWLIHLGHIRETLIKFLWTLHIHPYRIASQGLRSHAVVSWTRMRLDLIMHQFCRPVWSMGLVRGHSKLTIGPITQIKRSGAFVTVWKIRLK